jgi:outer membrane lipoprotein carrier protein
MTPVRTLLACLSIVLATAMTAAPVHAQEARALLDRFADDLTSLQGHFEQQVFNADGSLREEARGSVALKAPRAFRWEYEAPYEQLIVADGTHVWMYDVDLEQVTVKQQANQEAQSPLVVLTDPALLDSRYRVAESGSRDGMQWLTLTPVDEEDGFKQAQLGLDEQGLRRMDLEDTLGGRTTIKFSGWSRNAAIAADAFRFTPPEGVDLVGDTESLGDVRPID